MTGYARPAVRSACISVALLALLASSAAAEAPGYHAVVLSVGGDAPERDAREVRQAVAAALGRDGVRVLPEGELALRVPPSRLTGCDDARCARSLGRELSVAMVAAVATWQQEGQTASITVSLLLGEAEAYAASEEVEGRTIAEAAAAAVRGAQNARGRASTLAAEAAESEPAAETEVEVEVEEASNESPASETSEPPERSLEEWVLPGVLGVVGLALVAGAVYALMPEECTLEGASGVCLRGNGPNMGLGVLFGITGGLSIAGALVWLIVGGLPADMGNIDVVLGPDGGGLGWRGTF